MNEYMQFSAKNKNEAITKACIELGVSSDQLDIQVISEGSSGFFGIGSKPAIIKARIVEDLSEEKELEEIVDSVKLDAFKDEPEVKRLHQNQHRGHLLRLLTINQKQRQRTPKKKNTPNRPERNSLKKKSTRKNLSEKQNRQKKNQ